MPVDPQLRSLKIDLPAQPDVLVDLALMISNPKANMHHVGALIAGDMALASAVLKAVNSSYYGLRSKVQTVQQAITYLGTREISSLTFAMGLRAVFPHAPELVPLWQRAGVRAMLMSRIGQAINADAWAAHSAGLFEECGKAILFRHSSGRYRALLRTAQDDEELLMLEQQEFGVSHDTLGASLCESWSLLPSAVNSVRYHVVVNATHQVPADIDGREICALSAVANALMADPATLDVVVRAIAPGAGIDPEVLLRGALGVKQHIEDVIAKREER